LKILRNGIGIVPNLDKPNSRETVECLIKWLDERGYKAYVPVCTGVALGYNRNVLPINDWPHNVDFAVVLGGDGTLLGAARSLGPLNIPLLGVNLGHFGFLTELEAGSLFHHLPEFLSGNVERDERTMLSAEVIREGKTVFQSIALNEACVTKGPYGRLTVLSLRVSGKDVDTYGADGLIISTPTGSTAYSLSAGGPIVAPQIDAFLVTPICPHTLYSRSIAVPSSESCEIEITLPSQSTMLSLDGQEFFSLEKKDIIVVKKSKYKVALLRRSGWSFYNVLRKKMKEGADRLPRR
jgi:NAD+ kinase